jgi:hypothetical protein
MKIEKDPKILRLSLVTALIVAFAGTSVISPALSVSEPFNVETTIEGIGCLVYQTYPSQADCAVSIVPGGLLRV